MQMRCTIERLRQRLNNHRSTLDDNALFLFYFMQRMTIKGSFILLLSSTAQHSTAHHCTEKTKSADRAVRDSFFFNYF